MNDCIGAYHNATRIIRTEGIISDGNRLALADTQQIGFDEWVPVRTLANGICGGDFVGRISCPRGWSHMALGHEAIVKAAETGTWGGQSIKAGDLFVPIPGRRVCAQSDNACSLGAGACAPYINRGTSRWPGFATLDNLEDPKYLVPVPDLLADYGFMTEPLAICHHAIRTGLELLTLSQKRIALVGSGTLGLLTAALLVDMGIEAVGYDTYATGPRREAYDMLGTRATLIESDPVSIQKDASSSPIVFEMAGGQRSLADSTSLAAMGGSVVALGIPRRVDIASAHASIVVKGLNLKGIVSADRRDFISAISSLMLWVHTRPEFLDQLVTHRIPYTEFEKALRIDPKDRLKVAIIFQ